MALIVPAYAKLNLTLDVLGRHPDGYHEIDSVLQTISLHDLLWIERTDCRVFDVVGPAIEGENLVLKAARELEGQSSRQLPFTIRLFKRIPMGAGLGGGSADAAAFLKAANQLYGLKLQTEELAEIGRGIGQDVPFFLEGGTMRASGLGSTLERLPAIPTNWRVLLVCPPIEVSTREVYEAVDGSVPSARKTPALISTLQAFPPPLAGEGQGGGRVGLGNDLEPVTRRLFPAFDEAVARLCAVVPAISMTGTGSGLFAVFDDRAQATNALGAVRRLDFAAWLCHPVPASA